VGKEGFFVQQKILKGQSTEFGKQKSFKGTAYKKSCSVDGSLGDFLLDKK
jgi:hypothetical protein